MMYLLLTQVKNFISMKDLGITQELGINVYMDRLRRKYGCARHTYMRYWKGSIWKQQERFLTHGKDWIKIQVCWHEIQVFWHLVKSQEYFDQSFFEMYTSRYVLCSKCYEHIPEWIIKWSLDDSKDILMIFWKN